MYALRSFRFKSAPLTVAAAAWWATSARFERRTAAEPATKPQASPQAVERHADEEKPSPGGDGQEQSPFPPPIGPMIAVFLDQKSVDMLKARYPEASDGQLRKVVLQYGPSAEERQMYHHLFSGGAKVTVTGEASSFGRRALMASVSHAGGVIEPVSLSSAIDISPARDMEDIAVAEKDGPGPLASAVLIEQVKQAGAANEASWRGTLPPLLAHHRQFPSEEGAYTMLKEPIVVNGTICRADWVDGASVRCRDTLEGGEKRQEDWTPSGCSICAMFEASPCRDIFTDRFVAASKRIDAHRKASEPEENKGGEDAPREGADGAAEERGDEPTAQKSTGGDGNLGGESRAANVASTDGEHTVLASERDSGGGHAEGGEGDSHNRGEDGKENEQAARDLVEEELQAEFVSAMEELRKCMIFHDM